MAGPNSPYTALDSDQVIKQVYDETTDRLRVETNATVVAGAMEVLIDSDDDSVLVVGTEDGTKTGTQHVIGVNADGSLNVSQVTSVVSNSATLSNKTSSISSQVILASNSNRKGFIFFNDSTSNCYIAFASTASNSSFTIFLNSGMTYQNEAIIYTGIISGIWSSANGFLRVTELLP